jgi:hypothetical protein
MSTLIDKCVKFIEGKDAHYLAKEGVIVYFATITGRKSDYTWHSLTLSEAIRILKATQLGAEESKKLSAEHFIAAFQELDRVYEFAVKTRHKVSAGIFNYSEHSNESMGDSIMSMVVDELQKRNMFALYITCVYDLFEAAQIRMSAEVSGKDSRDLLFKHFEASGYEVRTGVKRVFIDGKKTPVIMKPGLKPSQVEGIPVTIINSIVQTIWRELK